jgi:predicted phage tail protein
VVQVTATSATASWERPGFDGGCSTLNYEIQWSTNGTSWGPGYNSTGSAETTQTTLTSPDLGFSIVGVDGVTAAGTVFYRVKAVCDGKASSFSEVVSVVRETYPGIPSNLSVVGGSFQATATWGVPSSGGSPITHYELRYKLSSGDWVYVTDITDTSYTLTDLANGGTYSVEVVAVNEWGLSGGNSAHTSWNGAWCIPATDWTTLTYVQP